MFRWCVFQRDGFFIECGALDGETRSNSLMLEQEYGWRGLLVEADPLNYEKLSSKHRKAWSVQACLSTKNIPMTVGQTVATYLSPHIDFVLMKRSINKKSNIFS